MHITILEFAPCADSIFHLRRDADEGYLDTANGLVQIKSGSKLRPLLISTYAGGKATNVARVIDKLLNPDDRAEIDLVVFRPDSPEGRYIHELQTTALSRVRVQPVIIRGSARFCIDLTDPSTSRESRVEFNISPRASWHPSAVEAASGFVSRLSTELLVIAGNPPLLESTGELAADLYSKIIEDVRARAAVISVDTEKTALANCLRSTSHPDLIKINSAEHRSVDGALWDGFRAALVVTDRNGCSLWGAGPANREVRVAGVDVENLYSTIGAGDAMHAGLLLARWVRGFDIERACRYGQAAAAASVSSAEGTRGITKQAVEEFFVSLERCL